MRSIGLADSYFVNLRWGGRPLPRHRQPSRWVVFLRRTHRGLRYFWPFFSALHEIHSQVGVFHFHIPFQIVHILADGPYGDPSLPGNLSCPSGKWYLRGKLPAEYPILSSQKDRFIASATSLLFLAQLDHRSHHSASSVLIESHPLPHLRRSVSPSIKN